MISPYTGGKVEEIIDHVEITFKGEVFELDIPAYLCVDTGNKFSTPEMTDELTNRVQDLWRMQHGVPTVSQLKELRKKLGLNKKEMSAFLNLGVNQYRYYEKGEIPKGAALFLLQLAVKDDFSLAHLISSKSHMLPEHTVGAYMDFCNCVFEDINVENAAIVVEVTPKVNKGASVYASPFVAEEAFQNYKLGNQAISESKNSLF